LSAANTANLPEEYTMVGGTATPGIRNSVFRPSLISWNLTRRCNLKCPHCYLEAGEKDEAELSTEECHGLIEEFHALGTEMLILTGGEPLLRRDIYDIASHASSIGMWVVMGTNGVLVNEHVADKMIACGVRGVGISIDSVDPKKHNSFRGGPNAWELSVRALDICTKKGLEVLVQSTVTSMNIGEIDALLAFARDKKAWSFNLYFLVQTGRGQEMNDLSAEETETILKDLARSQEAYKPMLVRAKCAPQYKQIAYDLGLGGLESGGCMAGTEYCRIMPSGDVTPCPYMTVVAGNVRQDTFTEIWTSSTVFEELRDTANLKGRCGRCEFKEMCGGCRCRAFAAFGDYLHEDPACNYEPTGRRLDTTPLEWTEPALSRLDRIPIRFIRNKVRKGVEQYARRHGANAVTSALISSALAADDRVGAFADRGVGAGTRPGST
jgi:radical SAM protein with 4Fe4S-binding SPASM domain